MKTIGICKKLILFLAIFLITGSAVVFGQAPVNDLFANRIVLAGTNITVTGSNVGATMEPGEPFYSLSYVGKSVWWTWTVPANGVATIAFSNSFFAINQVFTGDTLATLTPFDISSGIPFVAAAGTVFQIGLYGESGNSGNVTIDLDFSVVPVISNPPVNAATALGGTAVFRVTAISASPLNYQWQRNGTNLVEGGNISGISSNRLTLTGLTFDEAGSYAVVVSNDQGSVTNSVTLTVLEPAANDLFVNRIVLSGTNITTTGHNFGTTRESGEPNHASGDGDKSIWWTWTALLNETVIIDTIGSSFDTTLGIYSGNTVSNLILAASNDDGGGNGTSRVIFNTVAGQAYQIAVDGYDGKEGNITLHLNASLIPVITTSPQNDTEVAGNSVTFRVRAVSTSPLNYQWQHNGTNLVAGGNATGINSTNLTLADVAPADAGTYTVIVSNDNGSVTNSATLTVLEPPPNDLFINRIVLTGTNITATGSNVAAGVESGEPDHADGYGGNSVWWTWTALANETVVVDTSGSSLFTVVGIYTGDTVTNLIRVAGDGQGPGAGRAVFNALAGQTYQIAVDSLFGDYANITLLLNVVTIPAIISSPVDRTVIVGSSVTFGVIALSTSPLNYQWQHNGTNLVAGGNASGINSTNLTLTNVTLGDAGSYAVIVSNDNGSVTNSIALAVLEPPSNDLFINRIVLSGTHITTTGSTIGAGMEPDEPYSTSGSLTNSVWWTWTAPASGPVSIDTSSELVVAIHTGDTLTNLTEVGVDYKRVIFNAMAGTTYQIEALSIISYRDEDFTLNLNALVIPVIMNAPDYLDVVAGNSAVFQVTAISASPLSYQWLRNGTNLVESGNISGVTSTNLTLSNVTLTDAATYSVVVSNDHGSVTNSAVLTVYPLITLANNVTVTGISESLYEQFFVISVSPGQKRLTIRTAGIDAGETYLAVRFGSSSLSLPWDYETTGETSENIVITNPAAGDWYMILINYDLYSGATLLVDYSDLQPALGNLQINNNNLTMTLSGLYGWNSVIVESSTNLLNWLPIATNPVVATTLSVTNLIDPSLPQMFLRTVVK